MPLTCGNGDRKLATSRTSGVGQGTGGGRCLSRCQEGVFPALCGPLTASRRRSRALPCGPAEAPQRPVQGALSGSLGHERGPGRVIGPVVGLIKACDLRFLVTECDVTARDCGSWVSRSRSVTGAGGHRG